MLEAFLKLLQLLTVSSNFFKTNIAFAMIEFQKCFTNCKSNS